MQAYEMCTSSSTRPSQTTSSMMEAIKVPVRLVILLCYAFATYLLFGRSDYNLYDNIRIIINYRSSYDHGGNASTLLHHNTEADGEKDIDIIFEGSSQLLALLRKAHKDKLSNPLSHCQQQNTNSSISGDIRQYNRAIEIDFIGRDGLHSVIPTWSSADTASCHFTALSFPPTEAIINAALQHTTYIAAFHTMDQCIGSAFNWDNETHKNCLGNNWYSTMGPGNTKQSCIEESVGGYPIKRWLDHNSHDGHITAVKCLTQFLEEDESRTWLFDIHVLESSSTNNINRTKLIMEAGIRGGYDNHASKSGVDWNANAFIHWSKYVLLDSCVSNNAKNGVIVNEVITQLGNTLKGDRSKTNPLTQCVDKLKPLIHTERIAQAIGNNTHNRVWKDRVIQVSTMAESPTMLLRSFNASLAGVLPPPPTAVYATNAILKSLVVNVPDETYNPGCTPYWNAVVNENKIRNGPQKDLLSCMSNNTSSCPYPTYDIVIDVSQVYCAGFFHFLVEIWPRIAPFMDALLADDMSPFAIRLGCGAPTHFHYGFYALLGLDSSRVSLIGDETIHAKEVIIPTAGYSHSPLLNYWNLVSLRRHVKGRLHVGDETDSTPSSSSNQKKIVMVIVRDASRREDSNIYNDSFLQQLSLGLGSNYNVTAFRSSNDSMMKCLQCQVRAFMQADVIIGSHGAGLSHALFAKRGGILLERIIDGGDSRIYAELAFLNEMKYFPIDNSASAQVYTDIILYANDG